MELLPSIRWITSSPSTYNQEWLEKEFPSYKEKVIKSHQARSSEPFDPLKIKFDWGRVRIALSHIPLFIENFEQTEDQEEEDSNQIVVYYELEAPLTSFEPNANVPLLSTFVTFLSDLHQYKKFAIEPDLTLNKILGLSGQIGDPVIG